MRRPAVGPDLGVSTEDRDTWLGMANARVPSAFPIERDRIPDPFYRASTPPSGPTSSPPTGVYLYDIDANGTIGTLPVTPEGTTSAVVFVCNIGGASMEGMDGWTELFTGNAGLPSSLHLPLEYAVRKIDGPPTGAEGRVFEFPRIYKSGDPGFQYHRYIRGIAAYFYGGSGGTWNLSQGNIVQALPSTRPAHAFFASVPSDGRPFYQFGALRDVYQYTNTAPPGVQVRGGPAGRYNYPAMGAPGEFQTFPNRTHYGGDVFKAAFIDSGTYGGDDQVYWSDGYRRAVSVPLAAYWTP